MKRKIILFGGSFDPIHKGHTVVAAAAAEHIGADHVVLIPAGRSPHKQATALASPRDRLNMISLAIAEMKNFSASSCETQRPVPSYTLDTVRQLKTCLGRGTGICWLAGADAVGELPQWYKIEELIDECDLCIMYRAGFAEPDFAEFVPILGKQRVEKLQRNVIPTPLVDINSTRIRDKLARGDDVTDMLHPNVLAYIREKHLYEPLHTGR